MAIFKLSRYAFKPHWLSRWLNNSFAGWLLHFKQDAKAIASYESSVSLYASDEVALHGLANIFAREGTAWYQPSKALALLNVLMQAHGNNAAYYFNAAFIHQRLGQHLEAIALFEHAIERDPHLDRAWYGLGLSQIAAEQLESALQSLKRNTELQPMSPYGWYQLSMTHAHMGQWEQARSTAKHLNTFEPKFARGLKQDLEALKLQQANKTNAALFDSQTANT